MIKKCLQSIITTTFVFSILSSTMVCSADEISATTEMTTDVSTTTEITTKIDDNVSMTQAPQDTTTALETIVETNQNTTTDVTTSITTESFEDTLITELTTQESIGFNASTDVSTITSEPIKMIINDGMLSKLSYQERVIAIQSTIDQYLYNTTLSPNDALEVAKSYIKEACMFSNLSGKEVMYLYRYANNIVTKQNEFIKLNKEFYSNLESILNNVNYSNYQAIESYCRYLINNAFKNQYISSKETIKLMTSIHDSVIQQLSNWDLDLIEYSKYEFISNQSLVNKWNASYPDMKGWIYISNSSVDYPLMQYIDNNNYYLEHSWNGAESSRGTIELDYRCSLEDTIDTPEVTDNVLIYGHNLSDNTMFSSLENYKDKSYWEEHKLIEISTLKEQRLYKVYATCSIFGLADGTQFKYWDDKYVNMDENLFNEHLELTQKTMLYDTEDLPQFGQDILTLQTCDGNEGWRVVVFAKRVK